MTQTLQSAVCTKNSQGTKKSRNTKVLMTTNFNNYNDYTN